MPGLIALVVLASGGLAPGALAGQTGLPEAAASCAGGSDALEPWCREVALALRSAQGGVGMLAAGGNELPGSASTVGWRLESVPRLSVAGRLQVGRVGLPDLRNAGTPARERTSTISTLHVHGAVGVFDGFRPLPTVGGVLSVDLLGTGAVTALPESEGFDGSVTTWGAGVRVGLLQESFTLPGVTVSAARRWGGDVDLGSLDAGDAGAVGFDLSTTSLRATVGKDLLGIGLLAGAGWDRYRSRADLAARSAAGTTGSATVEEFETDRTLFFGGASVSFLVLQLSAEGGWASGYDPVPGRPGGGFDPEGSTPFGALSARLIF